jgi:ADP-ribose pyrophosphatase YjhB (NUDIX family)
MKKFRKSSGIILKYGDEVLLCKRSPEESLPNVWSIPAGGMENGESPGQTAIREFHEETNIELDTKLDFVGFIDRFKEDGTKKGHMFVFYIKSKTKMEPDLEKAKDGFEHTECKYFKKDNIPDQKGNEGILDILKKIFD